MREERNKPWHYLEGGVPGGRHRKERVLAVHGVGRDDKEADVTGTQDMVAWGDKDGDR